MFRKRETHWRDLHGHNYWKNLLHPLNMDLRRYLIHYGELAEATLDSFVKEPASRMNGSCRYKRQDILAKCDVTSSSMYEVTKFIYATSSILLPNFLLIKPLSREDTNFESNWIGYVAVSNDAGTVSMGRRDIVVAWRGTERAMEWASDFQFIPLPASDMLGPLAGDDTDDVLVSQGWLSVYTSDDETSNFNKISARKQVLDEVKRLVELYKDEEVSITITGHSLGSALSTLNAIDIASNGINIPEGHPHKHFPVTAFVFASPRVGNFGFSRVFNQMQDLRLLHVRNKPDIVPIYPLGYEHVGVELIVDSTQSGYLKVKSLDPSIWHSLEVYLHCVAGTQLGSHKFNLVINRDIALVNKHVDALKDEYHVPIGWWVEQNKGMVKGPQGQWTLFDHQVEAEH